MIRKMLSAICARFSPHDPAAVAQLIEAAKAVTFEAQRPVTILTDYRMGEVHADLQAALDKLEEAA